ncbi:hypothetical protein GWK47_015936 [Chionoecetes opilio]|uniref:Uncharacterized protein n=1 Tax=Chionoecetes opilio TaxID=41210 RepID=A0A8J5CI45_CHIOP|nr:hypothetical protein GWK47_015936 [Chionoecetes opilio]
MASSAPSTRSARNEPASTGKLQEDVRNLLRHLDEGKDPYQRLDSCVLKLGEVDAGYQNLKKSRKRGDTRDEYFSGLPRRPLDIGASDALAQMTFEEDRVFYQMQREDVTSCSSLALISSASPPTGDGKLPPDYTGVWGDVDRVPYSLLPGRFREVVAVPKTERGTGEAQAAARMAALDEVEDEVGPNVNHEVYVGAPSEMFRDKKIGRAAHRKWFSHIQQAMKEQQVRADYAEFLNLSLLFLGGGGDQRAKFRPPGPTHHARWMGKGLYVLKIFLFPGASSVSLPRNRVPSITLAFRALIYVRFGNGGSAWRTGPPATG